MLLTHRIYGALALVGAVGVAVNCGGSSDTTGSGGSGGGSTSSSSGSTGGSSSSSSSSSGTGGMECPSGMGTTLALTKIDFGEGNSGEWKKIGFNIDGLNSTATSTDVCMPSSGGSADMAYPDGDNGIDNSFGKNLLPIIISAYPTWPTDVNTNIQKGAFNAMFKMYCLPPKGDVPVMTTKLFGGTDLGMTPKFDGTDVWPVAPELLADPMDPESSTIVFDMSSVKGQLFDTGKDQMFILTLPMASQQRSTTIKLTLHAAQVKMTLSADRKSATGGVIGGVLDTEEFLTEVKKIGWTFGLCGSALYDSIVNQVRQSSDIMNDGTQDSSKTCNGISIGLGFEMKEVQLGDVGPKATMGGSCQ